MNVTPSRRLVLLSLLPLSIPCNTTGQESDDELALAGEPLTGEWLGARPFLAEQGLSFELYSTADVWSSVAGGRRTGTAAMGTVDLIVSVDLEPLIDWPGGRFLCYGLGFYGDSISSKIGDSQIVSNIDTMGLDTWKLYEAWYEQDLFEDRLSLLAGLYDLNSEFDVTPSAGLFLNSSFGIGAEIALAGRNGPSVFPETSLGVRVAWRPFEPLYLRAVVLDGVPGDPDQPAGTQVVLQRDDGLLLAAEIGLHSNPQPPAAASGAAASDETGAAALPSGLRAGRYGKYAVGVWGYTGDLPVFDRVDGTGGPLTRSGTFGAYAFAEQRLFHEADDPIKGLSVFLRGGAADERAAIVDAFLGAGAVYRGILPGRELDRCGLALAAAHFGPEFRGARKRQSGSRGEDWEVALELTYRARLTPWLTAQPDIQYVIDPGGVAAHDDAVVVALRFVVSF